MWAEEKRDALFLYLHVPFCEQRCGYCNLFSLALPDTDLVECYLHAMTRQAVAVKEQLGDCRFSRLAIGGGTPSLLSAAQLATLLACCTEVMGVSPHKIPSSIELSPGTVTAEKIALLREYGIRRMSIGIQSFDEEENRRLGRRQSREQAHRALSMLREARFPVVNIDLIYGGGGQTPASWMASLHEALQYAPEEVYLYPLYIRPFTALDRRSRGTGDERVQAYRTARDFLTARGYTQLSQRMFRAAHLAGDAGPAYCCQLDGMIGLGPCARSYTQTLHYSSEYAVERPRVSALLHEYLRQDAQAFGLADYGFILDPEEQQRRYLLKSILLCEGMSLAAFHGEFGVALHAAFPQLAELEAHGFAEVAGDRLRLTALGIEYSDTIGPWLYSPRVVRLMEEYPWR